MVACTCNSKTREAALKTESRRELQTVGQKGLCEKQAHQINPRIINTQIEACNLASYRHIIKGKIFWNIFQKHKGKNFCDI